MKIGTLIRWVTTKHEYDILYSINESEYVFISPNSNKKDTVGMKWYTKDILPAMRVTDIFI